MATAARNSAVHVNAFDLSGYFKSLDISDEVGLEESTVFGSTRLGKSWTRTLYEAVLSLKGFWDPTAVTGVNVVLRAALGAATQSIVSVWPTGDAVGQVGFGFKADVSSRKVSAAVEGLIALEAEFKSSVGDEEIVSLHSIAAAETGDGNGTTVDNGAATANGGAAYLQCPDVATSNAVTIRHSTDNFVGSDVLLGTFATVSADRGEERIEFTGTIHRYTRCVWDVTGGNSTFGVGLHRRPSA